jgi:hypothetical protein
MATAVRPNPACAAAAGCFLLGPAARRCEKALYPSDASRQRPHIGMIGIFEEWSCLFQELWHHKSAYLGSTYVCSNSVQSSSPILL